MRRTIMIGVLASALAVPAAAVADKPTKSEVKNASKQCRAERTASGAENFKVKYGTNKNGKNAFGKCVSRTARLSKEEAKEQKSELRAQRACRTEQEADRVAFTEKYGTNKNGKNAFGKCVSAGVEEEEAPVS